MEKDKKDKPLSEKFNEFLYSQDFTMGKFSKLSGVSYNTLYKISKYGHIPLGRIAKRIIKNSRGTFTLKDFDIDD